MKLMPNKVLLVIALIGMAMCLLIGYISVLDNDMSKEYAYRLSGLIVGILLSWVPYVATVLISKVFNVSTRIAACMASGLILYMLIDGYVQYQMHFRSESSTAGVAIILVLLASVIIVPAGALATYLFLPKNPK